ncbi:hypothetical protein CsSME_00035031 [Camellia sinensis var. sinensis]
MSKTFEGANVFMSRNLVPPEIFDSLHDSLKHNGAKLFLCSDPSRNGPDDFHVISSTDHEKFELLQKKGCNLLGPQCVLSCAKEHRPLPKQGFTCCLAMDGVKVLASGFEMDEKLEIGKMVTAMGGVLHAKTSLDVSFVIVKNVLAAKYKWALNVLKKPIVTLNWLHQCWKEHRIVSQESYRVLPFSGLTVCVTRIPADERREMEKVVVQNGGKYSAELTKKCTHLVSPEGDKYKVAKRWGHIHIVTRKWFDQSVSRRVCLNEESYPVQGGSSSSINGMRTCLLARRSQDKGVGNSQCAPSSVAGDSNLETVLCGGIADPELEATLSQNVSTTFSDTSIFVKEESGALAKQPKSDTNFDGCVADDSQNEDNDLYLSDCRILLLGFDASEMRKLVNMVRRGGGSRYMSFNEKLTHIVVGTPLEIEKKEVRGLAALGVIYVVRTVWLEDCDRTKKEVPVLQRHIAYELLLPKDPVCSNKGATMGIAGMKQGKASAVQSILPDDQLWGATNSGSGTPLDKNDELKVNLTEDSSLRPTVRSDKHIQFCAFNGKDKDPQKTQLPSCNEILDVKSLNVFKGKLFRFASSFPQARRAEIIQWVNQGGGAVVDEQTEQNAHFTVECHGVVPSLVDVSRTTHISSHWIRSCLEDGCLLDVRSHILYSPLPCRYDEKDRLLLRNLCFILGARFVEKLTKKVTHLLCKFTNGPKYEAACKWQIQTVTCEWIYECIKQSEVVAPGSFCPKKVTSQDREAGLCTLTQYPTQATRMISGDDASQFPSQSQDPRNIQSRAIGTSDNSREEAKFSSICGKRARLFEEDIDKGILSSGSNHSDPTCKMTSTGNNIPRNTGEVSNAVPDVAAAIEDLLAQTSKIHDLKSPGSIECDKNLFSSDCSILGQDQADPHSAFVLSKHWINRADRKDDVCDPSGDRNAGMYDGFSETQTESQVVGYEEDLSGRQMIIDRVRTRSSMI